MTENLRILIEQVKLAIAEEPEIIEYLAAKRAYIGDKTLSVKANEYNVQSMIMESESKKAEKDEQLIESVKARLDALYQEISGSETARRLIEAEEGANEFYNEIVSELQSVIAPEGGGCGGHCSSCEGCH